MTTTSYAKSEMKKNFILEKLLAAGVSRSQSGVDVRELDYESLKYEWVLQAFREVDMENENEGWF